MSLANPVNDEAPRSGSARTGIQDVGRTSLTSSFRPRKLVIGHPADPRIHAAFIHAAFDHAAFDRVAGAVEAARAGGARIHTGGLPHGLPPEGPITHPP